MVLQGNYYSDQFSYIKIDFELCHKYALSEGVDCQPTENIVKALNGLFVNTGIFKKLFTLADDNIESSFEIQKTIDEKLYFQLSEQLV